MEEQSKSTDLSKLSAGLQKIEVKFIKEDVADLQLLRHNVCKTSLVYKQSRIDFGLALHAYREVFKPERGWIKAAQEIATHVGCGERTIRNIVDDYERILRVPTPIIQAIRNEGLDPTAKKNMPLINKVLTMIPSAEGLEPEEAAETVKAAIAGIAEMKRLSRGREEPTGELETFAKRIVGMFEERYRYVGVEKKNEELQIVFELVNASLRCDVRHLKQHGRPNLVRMPKTQSKVSA